MPVSSATPNNPQQSLSATLAIQAGLLQCASKEGDKRLVARVLHHLPTVRRRLDVATLSACLRQGVSPLASQAINLLPPVTGNEAVVPPSVEKLMSPSPFMEVYLAFLCGLFLLDGGRTQEAGQLLLEVAKTIEELNNRPLDPLLARVYSFISRAHELGGSSSSPSSSSSSLPLSPLHAPLMLALRQSALRHDTEAYAALLTALLRMLIMGGRVEEADKLVSRSTFPETCSGANQARYHYYVASIRAIQADYATAKASLTQALRKAPHGTRAAGFLQAVNKLAVVVQLLLGELPDRTLFHQPILSRALQPYLLLCQAVRLGDLVRFQQIVSEGKARFTSDRTLILIERLHQNVLRAGLRRLSVAYSRIPLVDVQHKLCLPSVEDAAFVLLKAIKDGVIEGEINHAEGYLQSALVPNPYYTTEPQRAFDERIQLMNALHDDCLRAMRYPQGIPKKATPTGDLPAATEEELMEEYMDAEDDLGF